MVNLEKSYGKWILCGEHSVLRGVPALAFPVNSHYLQVSYESGLEDLQVSCQGRSSDQIKLVIWGVLDKGLEIARAKRSDLKGYLKLDNSLPIGAGMGASAALCVAVGKFFSQIGLITKEKVYSFSKELENLFHGESSGVDIAVSLAGKGIKFIKDSGFKELEVNWRPKWFLSYSGQIGVTSECVQKVKTLKLNQPEKFHQIDSQMNESVVLAESALRLNEEEGLELLAKSMDLANNCFKQWGLIPESVQQHMDELKDLGALSVKPTGSGGGGYVVSLWETLPLNLTFETIPL
ncbi:MAG: hypothetical protein KDD50_06965 [Bdellovibrionales bacterium]|nr:hypothetical protein [Bdellovibrionales bacterium]